MSLHPGQFRLERIQLVNWGTLGGYRDVPVPRAGMLLTGPSGSGKSTLLDAMTTVLVHPRWASFNAAAQAGDAGDRSRSIASYVRGAFRRETDADTGQVATAYLRPDATWSGVALTFGDARGARVSVARLFHLPRGRVAAGDVSTLYLVADESLDLIDLEPFAANGLEVRRLKEAHRGWRVESTYPGIAAQLQRRLGLASDQAQRLLHKTQSAKNLTSLNTLLRDFMLDEPETFELARQSVEQFTELSGAHASVVDARRQVERLTPLADHALAHAEAEARGAELARQSDALRAWVLGLRVDAETAREAGLAQRTEQLAAEVQRGEDAVTAEQRRRDDAQRRVDGLGGSQRQVLQERIQTHRAEVTRVAGVRAREAERELRWGWTLPEAASDVDGWRAQITSAADAARAELEAVGVGYELHEARSRARDQVDALAAELDALRRHRSNLGAALLAARGWLLEQLGVDAARLRFAGELVEVRPQFADWQGAIERVLRPVARTLLVPDDLYRDVAALVDARHLGVRLVYERMMRVQPADWPESSASVVNRVELADGEQHDWLAAELARRFDYACVGSAAELAAHTRAVTRAGQVKHSLTRHEKDDRSRVDDPMAWVLGFSTEHKEQLLTQRLDAARAEFAARDQAVSAATGVRDRLRDRIADAEAAVAVAWRDIDLAAAQDALAASEAELAELLRSSDDLAAAEAALKRADGALAEQRRLLADVVGAHAVAAGDLQRCRGQAERWRGVLAELPVVPPETQASLADRFGTGTQGDLDLLERSASDTLARETRNALTAQNQAGARAVAVMTSYKAEWPGRVADVGSDVADLSAYLEVLEALRDDRLPEFERRFFDLLQAQSRNNIAGLAMTLRAARREVRTRIDPINASLRRTEYSPGRHLHLVVRDRNLPEVTAFLAALEQVTQGSLGEEWTGADADDAEGGDADGGAAQRAEAERRRAGEQRFAVMKSLLDRLSSTDPAEVSWRNKCLDTRLHVEFRAEVRDADGVQTDVYEDSGGLSGGERQKLVTFCLAAALRYQLARDGAEVPAYGLVVLDEAFDKTDPEFTRAGLDVFTSFGFQLLLATPLKMLQTLEDYVGGITMVTNPDGRNSQILTSTWDDSVQPESTAEQESLL